MEIWVGGCERLAQPEKPGKRSGADEVGRAAMAARAVHLWWRVAGCGGGVERKRCMMAPTGREREEASVPVGNGW